MHGQPHAKIMNLDTNFTPFTFEINLKWFWDLNEKSKNIRLLEDNVGENLDDFGFGDGFLDLKLKVWLMKGRIDKLKFIKIKNFALWKVLSGEWKATNQEKIFSKNISNNGLLSKIYKEF